jgi:hypothetical protein
MTFGYQELTISGSRADTEGTVEFIRNLKTFMLDRGWTTTEDRTDQAGHADGHTRLVMQSNGEAGEYPTFYMVVISGSSATPATNLTYFQMATAYDTGAHEVPASGVLTDEFPVGVSFLNTRSQEDYYVWMSGDSEALAIVTRQSPSTYDSILIGRANSFMSVADNPYPLYLISLATAAITTADAGTRMRGVGGNPPARHGSSEMESLAYSVATNNQPYQLGPAHSIYFAGPLLLVYDDGSPVRKGAFGTVRNAWDGVGTAAGLLQEGRLTASGTSGVQTYRVFTGSTTHSLIMRET